MKAMLLTTLLAAAITPGFAQGTIKPAKAAKAAPVAPAAAAPAKAAPAPTATGFVGNKDSKLCHKTDCKAVTKMKDAKKVSLGSAEDAKKAGYKACKMCKPF